MSKSDCCYAELESVTSQNMESYICKRCGKPCKIKLSRTEWMEQNCETHESLSEKGD